MLGRIDQHHAVRIEQCLVALQHDGQVTAVLERQPGAAVAQGVGVQRRCGVERLSHSRADFAVPLAAACSDRVDSGLLPRAQLRGMRAALVPARNEQGLARSDPAQGLRQGLDLHDPGRIGLGPDEHEIVVHHVTPVHAPAFGDEAVFRGAIVHEHHVGIAAPADVQRLSRPHRHHLHRDARVAGE